MSVHCPKCKRILYNRRHKRCGFWGADLPEELLFSTEEMEALKNQEDEAEARRKRQRAKDDEEEHERRAEAARKVGGG